MNLGELVDRVRKAVPALASRLGRKARSASASGSGGQVPPGAEAAGEDGLAELLGVASSADASAPADFPGFAPPPSLGDRVRASAAGIAERVRGNPRALLAATGSLAGLALVLLAVALILRPPKPVVPALSVSPEALSILRRIPVPRPDPLAGESALDRPRKDRYTEEEVGRMWLDLGLLPVDALRERNKAELEALLSAMEKR
jgi:hypothetical protein